MNKLENYTVKYPMADSIRVSNLSYKGAGFSLFYLTSFFVICFLISTGLKNYPNIEHKQGLFCRPQLTGHCIK